MLLKHLKVLAIDSEYLIGMDVERILHDAFGCSVTVSTPSRVADIVKHSRFDVAVLDQGSDRDEFEANVGRLRKAASHLVFSISDREYLSGIPGFAGVPVVMKPFDGVGLQHAVASVLSAAAAAGVR